MKIRWPRLTFPPINLWTAPHQPALEDTMSLSKRINDTNAAALDAARADERHHQCGAGIAGRVRATDCREPAARLAQAGRGSGVRAQRWASEVQGEEVEMDIDAFEAKVRAGGKVTPCEAIKLAKHVREMEQRIGKGVAALSQELAEVKAERDALAAHVERLQSAVRSAGTPSGVVHVCETWMVDTHQASLARLKAQWQADGAESFKAELLKSTKTFIHPHIEGVHAVWLRRQAEESDDD